MTLILFKFINSTAGDAYRIGTARLGGFNGIPAFPLAQRPRRSSVADLSARPFYLRRRRRCSLLYYLLCRWSSARRFGRMLVGIRENERRAELLGYDVRPTSSRSSRSAAAMAGLAGCLFANWGEIVSPTCSASASRPRSSSGSSSAASAR